MAILQGIPELGSGEIPTSDGSETHVIAAEVTTPAGPRSRDDKHNDYMFASAQKNGLLLNDDLDPALEKLGPAALTKRRCKAALRLGTLSIAIGLVSYLVYTVVGSSLSFVRHGYDLTAHTRDISHQVRRFSPPLCLFLIWMPSRTSPQDVVAVRSSGLAKP